MEAAIRTTVYIDGFNLFYGALRHTPYRWLDLRACCRLLLPRNDVRAIKYYTAIVSARPDDQDQVTRQLLYLRALGTLPEVAVFRGHFLSHQVRMRLAPPGTGTVLVVKTEEKGSDVNLAAHLLHDAHLNRFDVAVVVSNDSDLAEPIRLVRHELGKPVGLLNPHPKPSVVLRDLASFYKPIRTGVLAASQFPELLEDRVGSFRRPAAWSVG